MAEAGLLLCGTVTTDGIAKKALDQLRTSIDQFSTRCTEYLALPEATADMIAFGPFCARVLLENCCAALLGRLDPFRILYLSEFQSQPEYEPSKRARSAFSWSGDVIPEERPAVELWSVDHDTSKISRALFSKHGDHIYWKPAVNKMLDHLASIDPDPDLAELRQLEAESYLSQTEGRITQLYSTLSKSVHWEYFSSVLVYDEVTVKTLIRDTCLLVGHLGLTSHYIPTAFGSLAPEEAVAAYKPFRRALS